VPQRKGYDPNQPRVPAGSPNGGEWSVGNATGYDAWSIAVTRMTELQKTKPHSLAKRFGSNGPNETQLSDYKAELREWNRLYGQANRAYKQAKKEVGQ
jgi:hypothetical protein